ncbi:MAG: hypothetical protein ACLU5J_03510 [Christensenellales bacterium]
MKQRVITAYFNGYRFYPLFFLGGWFITFYLVFYHIFAMYELITIVSI